MFLAKYVRFLAKTKVLTVGGGTLRELVRMGLQNMCDQLMAEA